MASSVRARVRRVVMLELELDAARRSASRLEAEVAKMSGRERAAVQAERTVAKAKRRVEVLEKEHGEAVAAAPEDLVDAARREVRARARTPAAPRQNRRRTPAAGPVTLSMTSTVREPSSRCRTCGEPAQLRDRGSCGPCLRAQDRSPCVLCGSWLTPKETRHHDCRPTQRSVRTVSGGAPGLGGR